MFKKIYLVILISSLIFTSCNKDESSNPQDSNQVGDFELTVSSITLRTAWVNWTQSENAENYDIYLDGSLLSSNVEELEYKIEGLTKGVSYSVKVIAKNNENTLEKSSSFTTLEEANLLLINAEPSHVDGFGTYFTYDDDYRIIKKEVLGCSQAYSEFYTLNEYAYNTEGKLIHETAYAPYGNQTYSIDYFYNNDLLSRIEKHETFSIGTSAFYEYIFSSELAYTMEIQYFDSNGDPTYNKFYNCLITKDSNNRITVITKNQSNGSDYQNYNFTYENGNLVRIQYSTTYYATYVVIEYDNKPSFHTYFSGTEFPGYSGNSCLRWDIMGIIYLEDFIHFNDFYDVLPFYRNTNANNPINYNNGNWIIEYEYNEYDYPLHARSNNSPNTLDFTYEVID